MVVFIRQINLLDICNTLLCSLFERIATLKQLKMMSWRGFILSAKLGAKLSWRHKLWVTIWECYGSLKDQSHSHGCFFYFYCFAGLEVPSIAQSFSFQIQKTFTQTLRDWPSYGGIELSSRQLKLYFSTFYNKICFCFLFQRRILLIPVIMIWPHTCEHQMWNVLTICHWHSINLSQIAGFENKWFSIHNFSHWAFYHCHLYRSHFLNLAQFSALQCFIIISHLGKNSPQCAS